MRSPLPQEVPKLSPEELLKQLIQQMCDVPEGVVIDQHVTGHSASFEIVVDGSDVSKVLGSGGSHAFALRQIFTAIYGRLGKKLNLLVVDPRKSRR